MLHSTSSGKVLVSSGISEVVADRSGRVVNMVHDVHTEFFCIRIGLSSIQTHLTTCTVFPILVPLGTTYTVTQSRRMLSQYLYMRSPINDASSSTAQRREMITFVSIVMYSTHKTSQSKLQQNPQSAQVYPGNQSSPKKKAFLPPHQIQIIDTPPFPSILSQVPPQSPIIVKSIGLGG